MDPNMPILRSNAHKPKTRPFIYVLTIFSAIGGFLFGYDTGVISGAMIILKNQFKLSNFLQEAIVAITVGFAAAFSLIGGILNSYWGRKGVIICASIIFLTGSVLLAAAGSREMLLSGRAVVGIGIGLSSMTVPMYIAEVSPPQVRGRLVTINNLFITGGQFVASCVDGFFSSNEVNGWRYMLGIAAIPAFIQAVGFLFLPESPRWLIQKGKYDKAINSLRRILGEELEVQEEFQMLKRFTEEEQRAKTRSPLCRMLREPGVRRALFVGCGLQMFQQLSGINTVMYYSATIVQMSGIRNDTLAIWMAAATAFVNFIFTFVGVYLVEKMGRRLLSLISIGGVTFSLLFLSTGFYLASRFSPPVTYNTTMPGLSLQCASQQWCSSCIQSSECGYCYFPHGQRDVYNSTCLPINSTDIQVSEYGACAARQPQGPFFASNYCPTHYSLMALCGMILYLMFFAPGMGPMPWTINSEIYPQWARSAGNAASTTTNWLFNVLVSLTFLEITQQLTTQGAFLLYAMLSLAGFIFIFLFLPETKGKSLEEVERLFERKCFVCCSSEDNNNEYHVILNQPAQDDIDSEEDALYTK